MIKTLNSVSQVEFHFLPLSGPIRLSSVSTKIPTCASVHLQSFAKLWAHNDWTMAFDPEVNTSIALSISSHVNMHFPSGYTERQQSRSFPVSSHTTQGMLSAELPLKARKEDKPQTGRRELLKTRLIKDCNPKYTKNTENSTRKQSD